MLFLLFLATPPVYFSGAKRDTSKLLFVSPPVPPRSCYSGHLRQQTAIFLLFLFVGQLLIERFTRMRVNRSSSQTEHLYR